MRLYHISTNIYEENPKQFIPRVPLSASEPEDIMTPRICFAPSVRLAIQATGYSTLEHNIIMVYELDTDTVNPKNIVPPYVLLRNKLVQDADETKEHWVLEPVTLYGSKYRVDRIAWANYQVTRLDMTKI